VLFMGRLEDHVKRVPALTRTFAAAANRFESVDLIVAGNGPDRERLRHAPQPFAKLFQLANL
jgi:hypothetical protein